MSSAGADAVGGLFVPLTEGEQSRVSALLQAAGLQPDGQGLREFLLSRACHSQRKPNLLDQAARFCADNPELVRATKQVTQAILGGRSARR